MNIKDHMKYFMEPKSIAMVGVPRRTGRLSLNYLENLLEYGYSGKIYPVNPSAKEIVGIKCYPTLESIHDDIDLALIATLWDSAARAHELLAVHASDIEFFATHARLHLLGKVEHTAQGKPIRIPGKTGQRTVPILECVPYLQAWLEYSGIEGLRPVWVSNRKQQLSYDRLHRILATTSHEVLGRHVHPHLIRKSRLSFLAEQPGWTPAMLCEFAGWKQGSSVQEVYIRLGVRGLEQAMLTMHGKEEVKAPAPSPMKPRTCFRCQYENPANARFCAQCSFVLDSKEARRIMNREHVLIEFMEWLVANPDKVDELKQLRALQDRKEVKG